MSFMMALKTLRFITMKQKDLSEEELIDSK